MIKDILIGIVLLIFQIEVFNVLDISTYVIPYAYPMILLGVTRSVNRPAFLIGAYLLGTVMDIYSNTGGAHAMACTVLAFLRPYFLSSLAPTDTGSESIKPSVYNLGTQSYIVYGLILLFIHHFIVFFMEVFSFSNFIGTLLRAVLSTVASVGLITVLQFIFIKKEN